MEENATDSDSDQHDPGEEAEMAVVGVEQDAEAGMVVMGMGDGGTMEPEGEGEDEEEQFDITLPATHSYLGTELEPLGGRRVLEAGWAGRVAGVAHHGAVFPGETVPMLLPPAPLRDHILRDRLFCLLCPDSSGDKLSGLGVVCEVLAGAAAAGVLARAAHRVRLRRRAPRALHLYTRMQMVEVVVLAERAPRAPLRPAGLQATPGSVAEDTSVERSLRSMEAAGSAWPAFVWQLLDYRRLRARLAQHFATLGLENKMPVEPVSLSFWVASNLALSARDRLALLAADDCAQRLHLALRCIDRSMALCCCACGAELARRDHIFAMSSDGVHANYTNYGGFMHDVLTVRSARELALGPPSAEFSWFPGYCWRVAQCDACATHVGWRFDAMKRNLRPSQFFALCRNVVAPRPDRGDYADAEPL